MAAAGKDVGVLTLEDQPADQGDLGGKALEVDVAHADSVHVKIHPGVLRGRADCKSLSVVSLKMRPRFGTDVEKTRGRGALGIL